MLPIYFAASEAAEHAEQTGILGFSPKSFIIQIITFVLVFILLKKFAFDKVMKVLDERHKVIDDGVRMGLRMEAEKTKFDKELAAVMRDARSDADKVVATAHKEAREIVREAEKKAAKKSEAMLTDAEERIEEEAERAKLRLEKDIVKLISEATEALVGKKVDPKTDAEVIDKILKGRIK